MEPEGIPSVRVQHQHQWLDAALALQLKAHLC
jgi:hypothetical protein